MERKILACFLSVTALAFFLGGCVGSGGSGRVRVEAQRNNPVTTETLKANWQEYTIYYSGPSSDQPRGILFDPKNDDKKLVGNWWGIVQDQKTLTQYIDWIRAFSIFLPIVQTIKGPDHQLFGYIYCPPNYQVSTRATGPNTVYVYELEFLTSGAPIDLN